MNQETLIARADDHQAVRRAWIAPVVQKIKAGDAEVGTRAGGADGTFTTS